MRICDRDEKTKQSRLEHRQGLATSARSPVLRRNAMRCEHTRALVWEKHVVALHLHQCAISVEVPGIGHVAAVGTDDAIESRHGVAAS
jgi:hypothetical protein